MDQFGFDIRKPSVNLHKRSSGTELMQRLNISMKGLLFLNL
jgi:hypothetical protein